MDSDNNFGGVDLSIGTAFVRGKQVVSLTVNGVTITFGALEAKLIGRQISLWAEMLDEVDVLAREALAEQEKK